MVDAKEYPCSFCDESGREWVVRLSVRDVHQFCAEQKLHVGEFSPGLLNQAQVVELAYIGTRWHVVNKAVPQTMLEFLGSIDGPSYHAAMDAAVGAMLNFILRTTPTNKRETVRKHIEDALAASSELMAKLVGSGETFSNSEQSSA